MKGGYRRWIIEGGTGVVTRKDECRTQGRTGELTRGNRGCDQGLCTDRGSINVVRHLRRHIEGAAQGNRCKA